MKRKMLAILTSVIMLCAMLPLSAMSVSAATSGTTGDCTWTLDGTHLTITGNGAMGDYIYYPYNGVTYTTAPWKQNITSITLEEGVTTIGNYAFYGCDSLTWIKIPDSVTIIGEFAFSSCGLLSEATLGDGVNTIEYAAFAHCGSLTSVNIPNSVITIERFAFTDCTGLESVTMGKNVVAIKGEVFKNCHSLSTINIPDSVEYIGREAFSGCESITKITIPNNVATIEEFAFSCCSHLTTIEVNENNRNYCDVNGVLFNKSQTKLICYPAGKAATSYIIPSEVTTIEAYAFKKCDALKMIAMGDNVTRVKRGAFENCTALEIVTIPKYITLIESGSFSFCVSLIEVYYDGSAADKANISIQSNNEDLFNAVWHYNPIDPNNRYSVNVRHSVMDTESGNGLAFRFGLSAKNVSVINHFEVNLTNATINYLGKDCRLISMGAVVANDTNIGSSKFTLEDVNGKTAIDIPATYLQEVDEDSCAFAVRIINIPDTALERTIYARPYYIVEVDGEEIVVYGDVDSASCAEYM